MRGRRRFFVGCVLLCIAVVFGIWTVSTGNWERFTYFIRPVWDRETNAPRNIIVHYDAPSLQPQQRCQLHGWQLRTDEVRVFDAFMVGYELDLVEIRLRELFEVVEKFVVLEGDRTFTGLPKALIFGDALKNSSRFDFAKGKILYHPFSAPRNIQDGDQFASERAHRYEMNNAIAESGIRSGDLLIVADADEIPSQRAIKLLKTCLGYPSPLNLKMRYYLYSFEFPHPSEHENWYTVVQTYIDPHNTPYNHGLVSQYALADAGWHCSFCLRTIGDVVTKMTSYSHADRVRFESYLDKKRIQGHLCSGEDIFDQLPTEWTFRELITSWGPLQPSYSAIGLPEWVILNSERFKFLLPGNCVREDSEGL
ncbi:glycosyl transferase [Cladochytrium replicatum]|nr:glycosyl transferase [Cladochytrium replicatum]